MAITPKNKLLVTGAGGFIGSHLVERLARMGCEVRAFVHYNSRNDRGLLELVEREVLESVDFFAGDLRDADCVRKAVKGCAVVFHLGALIAIPYSYVSPSDYVQTNVMGAVNLFNACLDLGVERVLHTSTSEVYGTAQYVPIDEKHPLQGQSPYSATKIAADKLAESYYRSFGLPVVTVRPFNTYGPRQSARAVIPTIITQALTQPEIRIGSLEPTRDLNYVDDIVDGFVAAWQTAGIEGEVINLGTGSEVSVGELASEILKIVGTEKSVVPDPQRIRPEKSEVFRLLCDNSKAKQLLNWGPKITMQEGLKRTVEWIAGALERYKADLYNI